jgi:hypothetical protein
MTSNVLTVTVLYTFVNISVYSLTPSDKSLVHNREPLQMAAGAGLNMSRHLQQLGE